MLSSTNPGQAQPQQMQGTNIISQGGLPTPEPSAPPDDRRNEAENQRLQAQPQQAQPQQLQGINNGAAQGGLSTQPSNPPEEDMDMAQESEETAYVREFLQARYKEAEGPLRKLVDNPYLEDPWLEVEKLNDIIRDRNRQANRPPEEGCIDREFLQGSFLEAAILRENMRNANDAEYKRLLNDWNTFEKNYIGQLQDNDYLNWTLPPPPPPPNALTILAHREMRNGNEYYVEKMIGDKTHCEVKTEAQLGPSAVRTYLSSDKKVSVIEHSMKYRK